MDEQAQILREILDLLRVIAEPSLAKRDEGLRAALLQIVGKSKAKAKAVSLMDGSRTQKVISSESGLDPADASRLVKLLRSQKLLTDDEQPKLVLPLPANFLDSSERANA